MEQVEELSAARRGEAIDVLATAFQDHPTMPADPHGRRSHLMIVGLLDAFAGAPDATLFGITREESLATVAFVYTDGYEPRGLKLVRFLWRMLRAIGFRMCRSMARVMSEKRTSDERRLELMLLGTLGAYQGQGMGRTMLRHLFEFARQRGYASVVLEAPKQTPAFELYLSEGFEVEKEIALPMLTLCMMRRPLVK